LSWGRALGPLGGLSTGQLNCCLSRMEEKRRESSKEAYSEITFNKIYRNIGEDDTMEQR